LTDEPFRHAAYDTNLAEGQAERWAGAYRTSRVGDILYIMKVKFGICLKIYMQRYKTSKTLQVHFKT